jgi:xyloglucan fucosyltransferase
MFGLAKIEALLKMEKKKTHKGCGLMQATIFVLFCTTVLLFLLLVYVISSEERPQFLHSNSEAVGTHNATGSNKNSKFSGSYDQSPLVKSAGPEKVVLQPEVQKLVDSLKEAILKANGGKEPVWTKEDSQKWNAENPCRSRQELPHLYERRNHVEHVETNEQWNEVLREYSKLHRTCLRNVGDLTDYFNTGNRSTGCKFLIADVMEGTGLGNKVLVVLSNLLYAVLTQRVLLVPVPTLLPYIMCEPFEGSTWRIDNSSLAYPPGSHKKKWLHPQYFFGDIDKKKKWSPYASAITYVNKKIFDQWHPRPRFYCSASQEHYKDIPWLYITGCLYTLPNLFAIGTFRPTLEALFPDKLALTHLLRTIMLPGDTIWDRTKRMNDAYLNHADRRVGIQVRYKDGLPHYQQMNDMYNQRIAQCALENGILPMVNFSVDSRLDDAHVSEVAPENKKVVAVFIACLYTGLHNFLTKIFLRHPTLTGESVALVQVTHEDAQEFGVEVDRQALAEVIGLSFADDLFVTPISTYGGLAQAYGALKPWFIEIRPKAKKACTRGRTIDICYQGGYTKYDCPEEEHINGKLIQDVVPYLTPCLVEDFPKGGVQLIAD